MIIERVEFETLGERPPQFEPWTVRIVIHGEGFDVNRAMPLLASLGEQPVELLVPIISDARIVGVHGLLRTPPQAGDALRIGYLDTPLFATGFAFTDDPINA
jgi:hypothetical protein